MKLIDEKNLLIGFTQDSVDYLHQYRIDDDNNMKFLDRKSGIKTYGCNIQKINGEGLVITEYFEGNLLLLS